MLITIPPKYSDKHANRIVYDITSSIGKIETNDENGPNGFGGWAFRNGYYTNTIGLAYRNEKAAGHVDENGKLTAIWMVARA